MDRIETISLLRDALERALIACPVSKEGYINQSNVYIAQEWLRRQGHDARGCLRMFELTPTHSMGVLALCMNGCAVYPGIEEGWSNIVYQRAGEYGLKHDPLTVVSRSQSEHEGFELFERAVINQGLAKEHDGMVDELHAQWQAERMQAKTASPLPGGVRKRI